MGPPNISYNAMEDFINILARLGRNLTKGLPQPKLRRQHNGLNSRHLASILQITPASSEKDRDLVSISDATNPVIHGLHAVERFPGRDGVDQDHAVAAADEPLLRLWQVRLPDVNHALLVIYGDGFATAGHLQRGIKGVLLPVNVVYKLKNSGQKGA